MQEQESWEVTTRLGIDSVLKNHITKSCDPVIAAATADNLHCWPTSLQMLTHDNREINFVTDNHLLIFTILILNKIGSDSQLVFSEIISACQLVFKQ